MTSTIALKRGYEPYVPGDGTRVLVDRLWLRGVFKDEAKLDAWMKELGPSPELRKWFGHQAERWEEFRRRYEEELKTSARQVLLALLRSASGRGRLTLVYGAEDTERNAAVVVLATLVSGQPVVPIDRREAVLAAIDAVSAARSDGIATMETIAPFVEALVTPETIETIVPELVKHGDVRETASGWKPVKKHHRSEDEHE